jgi:hypothetical protein
VCSVDPSQWSLTAAHVIRSRQLFGFAPEVCKQLDDPALPRTRPAGKALLSTPMPNVVENLKNRQHDRDHNNGPVH